MAQKKYYWAQNDQEKFFISLKKFLNDQEKLFQGTG